MTVETANLTEAIPQSNGAATVGAGVVVTGISRAYSQAAANQLNTSQSSLGQLNALQNYSSQIDNLFGTTIGGLSTSLQSFYSAFSDVANNPTSTASRQALLGQAQAVATSFQNASSATQLAEYRRQFAHHGGCAADQFHRLGDLDAEPANRRGYRAGRQPAAQ